MSENRCTCPPFVDGGVLVRKGCPYPHKKAEPKPAVEIMRDPELDEIACAWSDYRSAYGASGPQDHKAFVAGWRAARGVAQIGVLR